MLKKLGIPTLLLAAALMVAPAKAAVRFGVGIGGPVYVPAYPTYSGPYYGYPYAYYYGQPYYYGRPYVYGYYGHHHHGHWRHGHWR